MLLFTRLFLYRVIIVFPFGVPIGAYRSGWVPILYFFLKYLKEHYNVELISPSVIALVDLFFWKNKLHVVKVALIYYIFCIMIELFFFNWKLFLHISSNLTTKLSPYLHIKIWNFHKIGFWVNALGYPK